MENWNSIRHHFCERLNKGELKSLLGEQDGELGGLCLGTAGYCRPKNPLFHGLLNMSDGDKSFSVVVTGLRFLILFSSATGHYLALQVGI